MLSDIIKEFPEVIETERLLIRPLQDSDENDIFEYASDPEVARFMAWDAHKTIEDTRDFLRYIKDLEAERLQIDRGIILKAENKLIGTISFVTIDYAMKIVELGYCLSRAYWGHGYAVEAGNAMIDAAVKYLKIHRIEAECSTDNVNSERVMMKLGMQFEGIMRQRLPQHHGYQDAKLYAKVINEAKSE